MSSQLKKLFSCIFYSPTSSTLLEVFHVSLLLNESIRGRSDRTIVHNCISIHTARHVLSRIVSFGSDTSEIRIDTNASVQSSLYLKIQYELLSCFYASGRQSKLEEEAQFNGRTYPKWLQR